MKKYVDLFDHGLKVGFALLIAVVLHKMDLRYIEDLSYDLRIKFKPRHNISNNIQTVVIDHDSSRKITHTPNIVDYNIFFESLYSYKPRSVIVLLHIDEIKRLFLDDSKNSKFNTSRFKKNVSLFKELYICTDSDIELQTSNQLLTNLKLSFCPILKDGVTSITRRFLISYQNQNTLHPNLAMKYFNLKKESDIRGIFSFFNSNQGYINYNPVGEYKPINFADVLNKVAPISHIKDKIIFIGKDTDSALDYVRTPYDRKHHGMTWLELNANILDTIILNNSLIRTNKFLSLALTFIISLISVYVILLLNPLQGIVLLLTMLVTIGSIAYVLIAFMGIWLEISPTILSVFICYYFFIPYRLVVEHKKNWEFEQKNTLLLQVEELKNNFMSMMSHDLKTPLARIQGMCENALQEAHPLSSSQKGAFEMTLQSVEDLSKFVTSVLNISRIESQSIKLHKSTKDINTVLSDIVYKYDYLAKKKNIEIYLKLEPIFSIKIDEDLMRQVFANLLENSIKYSPNNSCIFVKSEEIEGKIRIQFVDQGCGISERDMPYVFQKFYRSKDNNISSIKGSGLGLYLSKYFVELHGGHIDLESTVNKGSIFSVYLP